ncbi:MAG TPA: Cache 3/Cache 2 fusion domain-containing protein [Ktedonobacterales bacterium]
MRHDDKNSTNNTRSKHSLSAVAAHSIPPASAGAASPERRRRFRRLRLRQRIVPLLAALVLLSSCGIVALAYLGARADVIASAQSRAKEDVRVERQLLADQGANITSRDGQLFVGVDNAAVAINDDTTIVDRIRSLVNGYATIYQLEGTSLVAISTNLPTGVGTSSQGSRALGDTLTGPAFDALLGRCGAIDTADCHHSYSGVVMVRGVSYAAAYEPLTDGSGAFVGALSVAIPLDGILAPTGQFAVMLLLVALLMAVVTIVAGSWIFGAISARALGALDAQLDVVADATIDLDHLSRAQIERAERQTRTARQVSDEVRALNALARSMDEGQSELRTSTGEIWAEMSHPGAAPDPNATLRWARQAAVASGRIGSAAEHARDLCQHIVVLMNHIVAEGNVVSQRGREMQVCARELRGSVEQVEMTLGERLIKHPSGLGSIPVLRRIGPASRRLGRILTARASRPSHAKRSAPGAAIGQRSAAIHEAGDTDGTGSMKPRSMMGKGPRISPTSRSHSSGHLNRSEQTGQQRVAETGEWRRAGDADGRSSGQPQSRMPQPSRPRRGAEPRDPQNANGLGLPDLPEGGSSWRWINPNENRWLNENE